MELLLSLGIAWAIMHFWEAGKREYGHVRDRHAAEIAREHPAWSPRKIQRRAKRRARGYWWDQIRRGFPDLKEAYEEDRLIAERERVLGSLEGEKRRRDLRDQIRKAIEEHIRIKEEERQAEEARRAPQINVPEGGPANPANPATPAAPAGTVNTAAPTQPAGGAKPPPSSATPPAPKPKTAPNPKPAAPTTPIWPVPPISRVVPAGGDADDIVAEPEEPSETPPPGATVIRLVPEPATEPASQPAGGTMTEIIADASGYEQILTGMTADVEGRTAEMESISARLERLQDRDAAYEMQMAALRSKNADDQTIETIAHLREANEAQIRTAQEQVSAAEQGLSAATSVRDDWVARHGAVMEAKASTGAAGDEALYRA